MWKLHVYFIIDIITVMFDDGYELFCLFDMQHSVCCCIASVVKNRNNAS